MICGVEAEADNEMGSGEYLNIIDKTVFDLLERTQLVNVVKTSIIKMLLSSMFVKAARVLCKHY